MSEEKKPEGGEKKPESEEKGHWLMTFGLTKKQAQMVPMFAVVLAIGILFLQAGTLFGVETGSDSSERPPNATLVTGPARGEEDELTRLERRIATDLEERLSWIRGAGQVRVLVTLESGPTIDVVKNTSVDQSTTTEKAADNSTRETQTTNTSNDHVFYREGSAERPVVARTGRPEIAGVLIVAEGARDARIRARLLDAATIALKVPANRIEVVPADRGE
ncbi:MAG: stage III sporulation protein AG [Bacillota bacterium]